MDWTAFRKRLVGGTRPNGYRPRGRGGDYYRTQPVRVSMSCSIAGSTSPARHRGSLGKARWRASVSCPVPTAPPPRQHSGGRPRP